MDQCLANITGNTKLYFIFNHNILYWVKQRCSVKETKYWTKEVFAFSRDCFDFQRNIFPKIFFQNHLQFYLFNVYSFHHRSNEIRDPWNKPKKIVHWEKGKICLSTFFNSLSDKLLFPGRTLQSQLEINCMSRKDSLQVSLLILHEFKQIN